MTPWSGSRGTRCPKCDGGVCSEREDERCCETCGHAWEVVRPGFTIRWHPSTISPLASHTFQLIATGFGKCLLCGVDPAAGPVASACPGQPPAPAVTLPNGYASGAGHDWGGAMAPMFAKVFVNCLRCLADPGSTKATRPCPGHYPAPSPQP